MGAGFCCGFRAVGLSGSEGTERNEHGGVDGTGILAESADDLLESRDGGLVERGGVVGFGSELSWDSIVRFEPGMGRMLGTRGFWMLEALKGFGNIAGHGEVGSALTVVPLQGETNVLGTGPVGGDVVELAECG